MAASSIQVSETPIVLYTLRFRPPSLGWAAAALIISAAGAAMVTSAGGLIGHMARWLMVALILAGIVSLAIAGPWSPVANIAAIVATLAVIFTAIDLA